MSAVPSIPGSEEPGARRPADGEVRKSKPTSGERRLACDKRKRESGEVRVSLWVPPARQETVDFLISHFGFDGIPQAINAAIDYTAAQVKASIAAGRPMTRRKQ